MTSRVSSHVHAVRAAFTLVELLAATAVLTLLLVVLVQMINSVTAVTAGTSQHLDADSQARLVFDRMSVDLAQIVRRTDVDYFFVKNLTSSSSTSGNDQMAFYSETSGYYPSWVDGPAPRSNAALVGYCIRNAQLQRLNKALVWNGAAHTGSYNGPPYHPMTFLPQTLPAIWPLVFSNTSSSAPTNPDMSQGTDADYQVIGESVFRMEICYLLPNTIPTSPASTILSDTAYLARVATPTPSPSQTPYNGMRDVASVVVTLAVLDDTSRLIIPKTSATAVTDILNAVAAKLEDGPTNSTTTPAAKWQAAVENGTLAGAGLLPKRAASQVRIYERYFPVGNAR